jgi:hypothetical protein
MMKARVLCVLGTTGLAASLGACSSMPKPSKDSFSARSGVAAGQAVDQTYDGFGDAAQAPLLDTCPAISEQVRQLDLALGPDVDIPRGESAEQDMFSKGASFAADAALDAVRSATTGVIPVRSWVRRFSGANRAEQEAKAVVLAGAVRRGYLKALGQVRGCDWPAAPLKPQTAEAIRAKLTADPALPPAALEAAAHTAAASGQLQAPPAKPQN